MPFSAVLTLKYFSINLMSGYEIILHEDEKKRIKIRVPEVVPTCVEYFECLMRKTIRKGDEKYKKVIEDIDKGKEIILKCLNSKLSERDVREIVYDSDLRYELYLMFDTEYIEKLAEISEFLRASNKSYLEAISEVSEKLGIDIDIESMYRQDLSLKEDHLYV